MKVYVVIPHYGNYGLVHARLWELYKHCRTDIEEVLVVDDCSPDEDLVRNGLNWWSKEFPEEFKVRWIQPEQNSGFLLACNLGLSDTVSKCNPEDIIILLSNDVEIKTNFISQVTHILRQPRIMVGGVLLYHDTGWNTFNGKIFSYLEGWLLALKAEDWKLLDYFDERFVPTDYDDMDLSTKALASGFQLSALNNPGLHHIGGQTYGYTEKRRIQTEKNREKFRQKWIGNSG